MYHRLQTWQQGNVSNPMPIKVNTTKRVKMLTTEHIPVLAPQSQVLVKQLTATLLMKKFPVLFKKPKSLLQCSQQPKIRGLFYEIFTQFTFIQHSA
jgi:hypothetical protein